MDGRGRPGAAGARGPGWRVPGRVRTAGAVLFLVAWAWPILDPGAGVEPVSRAVLAGVWGLFAVDYGVRLARAGDRRRFVAGHVLDLAVVAFPLLRQFQVLRLVGLGLVVGRRAAADLRGRVAVQLVGGAALLELVGALAVLDAERGAAGASIVDLGDALWWAASTMSTVGYGDVYPVTGAGRAVGVVVMFGGLGVLGLVTALLASWLVEVVLDRRGAAADGEDGDP